LCGQQFTVVHGVTLVHEVGFLDQFVISDQCTQQSELKHSDIS